MIGTYNKYLFALLAALLISCGGEKKDSTSTDTENRTSDQTAQSSEVLEPLSAEVFNGLRQQTDYIDIIFNYLPLSLSVDQPPEIETFFNFFAPEPFNNYKSCTNEGTITMLSEGRIIGECHMYYGPNCFGFVFLEDGKPNASMRMNDMGINYFNQIIASASQMQQQMQQQGGQ